MCISFKLLNYVFSPIKRLYSVVTLNENGVVKKCIVLLHWVDEVKKIVDWPLRGKKPIHHYTNKWLSPGMSWQELV